MEVGVCLPDYFSASFVNSIGPKRIRMGDDAIYQAAKHSNLPAIMVRRPIAVVAYWGVR